MKKLLLLLLLSVLVFSGCDSKKTLETASSKVPLYIVHDKKNSFDFNATIAFNDKIYSITDETIGNGMLEKKIGEISRDVTSHALLNGDYGFYTLKKTKRKEPYVFDNTYQTLFNSLKNMKVRGNGIYKIRNLDSKDAIAIKFKDNSFRKFSYLGDMNSFYKTIKLIIKPIVFVPFLVLIYVIFILGIVYFE